MKLYVGLADGKEIAGDNVKTRPFATLHEESGPGAWPAGTTEAVVVMSREQAEDLWKWLGATLYGLDIRVTRSVDNPPRHDYRVDLEALVFALWGDAPGVHTWADTMARATRVGKGQV